MQFKLNVEKTTLYVIFPINFPISNVIRISYILNSRLLTGYF